MEAQLYKIPAAELNMPSFQEFINTKMVGLKDQLLIEVLKQCTGREIILDQDIKDMSFIHHEKYPQREFLAYKGNLIGEMVLSMPYDEESHQQKITYTFHPKTEFGA